MKQMKTIPVYLITGFLDSGKTTLLTDTLNMDYFNDGQRTVLLRCEDGEEEFDQEHLSKRNCRVLEVNSAEELTYDFLMEIDRRYQPERVLFEYNGMWPLDKMRELKMPKSWGLYQINNVIDSTKDWGTMPGNLQQVLKASLKAKIDWRKILSGFRASILSSERKSTRMRPNRRSGFDALGSVRRFNTKLLVAVDVSGSVTDKSVSDFYGVVNSAFRYGFEAVDVLQFDQGVRSVVSLTKAVRDFAVCGRGGTSFQEPIDYAHANGYEGLVILTDGYAPQPEIPLGMKARILWVCVDRESYDQHKEWMSDCGRVCTMQLRK